MSEVRGKGAGSSTGASAGAATEASSAEAAPGVSASARAAPGATTGASSAEAAPGATTGASSAEAAPGVSANARAAPGATTGAGSSAGAATGASARAAPGAASAAPAPVLRISGLEKDFGEYRLGPVSLELERGYVYALMGPNGSGKSTLFRSILRLIQPSGGEVEWFGRWWDEDMIEVKQRVCYVPDQLELPMDGWTLGDWMRFVSRWYPRWNRTRYLQLLKRYDLPEHKKLRSFSKGMKAKAAFVLALSREPEVLLLDEPSSGMDPFAWRMMMEDIAAFVSDGEKTVVIATHILDEIRRMADFVVFLHEGEILEVGEKDTLIDEWKMFWIDRNPTPHQRLPGVVALEPELPVRLISSSAMETEEALAKWGISVTHTRSLEMDEIFAYLLRSKRKILNRRELVER